MREEWFPSGCKRELEFSHTPSPKPSILRSCVQEPHTGFPPYIPQSTFPLQLDSPVLNSSFGSGYRQQILFTPSEAVVIYYSLWNSASPNTAMEDCVLTPCQASTDVFLCNSRIMLKPCIPSTHGAKWEKRGNKGMCCEGLLYPKIVR